VREDRIDYIAKGPPRGDEKILVRGTNWIGDSVMSVPALRELRRLFPNNPITLMARPWVAGLFEDQGLVDDILAVPEDAGRIEKAFLLKRRCRGFDRAVLFQNAFSAALAVRLAGIPQRIGYRRDGRAFLLTHLAEPRIERLGRHQVYYYLDLIFQAGLSPVDYLDEESFSPRIDLQVPARGLREADSLLRQSGIDEDETLVTLNPGAYFGPAKRWFTDRYARLADQVVEELGAKIAIVGSAGELRIAKEIQSLMKNTALVLSGRTDLAGLMGILGRSSLFITNDSGPMHVAAALGIPQIALFGSTDEVATGPFSSKAQVIHKHAECSPCLLRECPIDLRCFDRITVEEVFLAAKHLLS
jgi:heptosyltransferase-2